MALKNYVDQATIIDALWLNQVDILKETVFGSAATKATAIAALFAQNAGHLVNIASSVDGSANGVTLNTNVFSYNTNVMIVFSPNQANTSAVTINPNGLGIRNLVMPDGTPLLGSELLAGYPAMVIYSSSLNRFFLMNPNPSLGSFTGTITGVASLTQATVSYLRQGKMIGMSIPQVTGISNSNALTLTGVPAAIAPRLDSGGFQTVGDFSVLNAGVLVQSQVYFNGSVLTAAPLVVSGSSIFPSATGFGLTGSKGFGYTSFNYWTA